MPIYALGDLVPKLPPPERVWVAPDAQIIGWVDLGEDCSVWFGAVLRGDNELIRLGPETNIQDGAVLHTDMGFPLTLGRGCTVGHRAILHGCTVGDYCLIGMGATVMNGTRIGSGSVVGANALIPEGKTFPENSLIVGAPARAIRVLDDVAINGLRQAAAHYVRNARRFATDLRRLD